MRILTLLNSLATCGLAAASQWQEKRATAPAYAAHAIEQPVNVCVIVIGCMPADGPRSTISQTLTDMNHIHLIRSSNDTSLTRHITNLADQYFSTLVERQAGKADFQICKLEVSVPDPP